jgi:short-subunit dehydrogenase
MKVARKKGLVMQLSGKRIVLTGAAGGMGELIASELAAHGGLLVLTDLNEQRLTRLADRLGSGHTSVAADLCTAEGRAQLVQVCRDQGGIDVLINAAGMSEYAMLENQSPERIELMAKINLIVPMLLCKAFVPQMAHRPDTAIVNIGSTFGSIGHPGFASYCATKFGLRGFTESLRRELSDTAVQVFYIAPRATRTSMNSDAVVELNRELGNTMDEPEVVVASLLNVLTNKAGGDYFLGWPEKLFVRLNGLLPKLVDGALGKQLATIRRLAG